jgi:hypothetical protein
MAVPGPPWTYRSVDVGLQCITYTARFPQDTSPQYPTESGPAHGRFVGLVAWASPRSCKHLPARPQPPRGWADGSRPRGLRSDHFQVPVRGGAACTADAPMWCDGGSRKGRERRHTIGARSPDSSAPETPVPAAAVGELVSETVRLKAVGSVYLKELPYLLASPGIHSRCHRLLVVRIAE